MTRREPPKVAAALLKRLSTNDALAGDLREAYAAGKSAWWYWRQTMAILWRCGSDLVSASWCIATIIVAMVVLDLPYLTHLPEGIEASRLVLLMLYLVPQAISIAMPVGVAAGIVAGTTRRIPLRTLLIVAVLWGTVTFAIVGWLVPASNQAYRVVVAGRDVARGAPELNFVALRSLVNANRGVMRAPLDGWRVAENYQARFAVSCAPMTFTLLLVSVGALRQTARRVVVAGTALCYLALFVIDPRSFNPIVTGWSPDATVIAVALFTLGASRLIQRTHVEDRTLHSHQQP